MARGRDHALEGVKRFGEPGFRNRMDGSAIRARAKIPPPADAAAIPPWPPSQGVGNRACARCCRRWNFPLPPFSVSQFVERTKEGVKKCCITTISSHLLPCYFLIWCERDGMSSRRHLFQIHTLSEKEDGTCEVRSKKLATSVAVSSVVKPEVNTSGLFVVTLFALYFAYF